MLTPKGYGYGNYIVMNRPMKTINNTIIEQRVGFPNAKLLKEKGFDCFCSFAFNGAYEPHHLNIIELGFKQSNSELIENIFTAPTQQLAIDFIRINFNIHIYTNSVEPFDYEDKMNPYPKIVWISKINDLKQLEKFVNTDNGLAINHFHTPEEAKEAAINHVLTKMI